MLNNSSPLESDPMKLKTLSLLLLVLCSSCGALYIPSARNVPMFEEKGEFQATLSYGSGLNSHLAYSPLKSIAISAGLFYANAPTPDPNYRQHTGYEAALGFYTSGNMLFEVFGGYGRCAFSGRDSNASIFSSFTQSRFHGNYEKFFFQPTLGFRAGKRMVIGVTPRLTHIYFRELVYTTNDNPDDPGKVSGYFFEPSVTFKIHPFDRARKFFVLGQGGLNVDLIDISEVYYNPFHVNFGIGLRLSDKLK